MIDLNGIWFFSKGEGSAELNMSIPGCWENVIQDKSFAGPANIWREFEMPEIGQDEGWILLFGGVSYYCEIHINGKMVGSHEGIWDRFHLDATCYLLPGKNEIRLVVWKPGYSSGDRFKVREVLSGFIPDVCVTFGGIWDDVKLIRTHGLFLESHFAEGKPNKSSVVSKAKIRNYGNDDCAARVCWEFFDATGNKCAETEAGYLIKPGQGITVEGYVDIEEIIPWELDNPYLYSYRMTIRWNGFEETVHKRFGVREIKAEGDRILLNGHPLYIRGLLHWGYYDEIIPNPSRETIRDEIVKCKAFGFNTIKHCLYIPREEYFELADELGILQWIELPLWLPDVTPELSTRMEFEYPRIISQFSGYTSVIICSLGCELNSAIDSIILEKMYHLVKKECGDLLVRDNSGSGECYEGFSVDYADFYDYHFYGDLQNMEHLMEAFTAGWRKKRPWLYGEFCDSDTWRDMYLLREENAMSKMWWEHNDVQLNPMSALKPDFRMHLYDERVDKYGLAYEFDELNRLSKEHSMVHRKMTIELTRLFPEICGYNITCIRDVPIATSGVFTDRMLPKFDTEEWKSFNADIVLAPAWDLTRIWINADRVLNKERFNFVSGGYYGLHVVVSNYAKGAIRHPRVNWEILNGTGRVAFWEGIIEKDIIPGEVTELVYVNTFLPEVMAPASLKLKVKMESDGAIVENCWPIWIFPRNQNQADIVLYDTIGVFKELGDHYRITHLEDCTAPSDCNLVVTTRMTPQILKYLEEGGRVFFMQRGEGWLPIRKVAFWREGMLREYPHEILKDIPENIHDDLKYFSLSTDTAIDSYSLSDMKPVPIIRRYDCREFEATDYMVELKVGKGHLIATTLGFEGGMGKQPNFMKYSPFACYLFERIINYLRKK